MTTYAWISILVLSLAVLFVKKRLSLRENIIIFVTIAFISQMSDRYVGAILDLFDIGPTKEVDLIDLFFVPIVPSCIAILFLNTFKRSRYVIYAIVWSVLSFLYEWSLVYFGYMKLRSWKPWYSIPVYIAVFFLLPWYLRYIKRETAAKPERKYRLSDYLKSIRIVRRKEKTK